ncbi:MAG TPA: hypothetical protein VNN09_14570 [Candidatus Competibacteraceae bacterium]|nr:hypothetical protein [Candidatus Competibacteraceae bacterium]
MEFFIESFAAPRFPTEQQRQAHLAWLSRRYSGMGIALIGRVFAEALQRCRAEIRLAGALEEATRLKNQLEAQNVYLREAPQARGQSDRIIGKSSAI